MNREDIVAIAREAISPELYAEIAIPFCETIWMLETWQLEKFVNLIEIKIIEDLLQEEHISLNEKGEE